MNIYLAQKNRHYWTLEGLYIGIFYPGWPKGFGRGWYKALMRPTSLEPGLDHPRHNWLVTLDISYNTGWWWLEPWNFMTFHKKLGMEQSSQLTKSIIFQRGRLNHQPVNKWDVAPQKPRLIITYKPRCWSAGWSDDPPSKFLTWKVVIPIGSTHIGYTKLSVSINGGFPKWMVYHEKSQCKYGWIGGSPIYGTPKYDNLTQRMFWSHGGPCISRWSHIDLQTWIMSATGYGLSGWWFGTWLFNGIMMVNDG